MPETLHSLPIWEKLTPTEVSDTIYKHRQLCYTVRAISRLSDLHFPPKLTTRESEILPLLLAGITRDEIASSLSVSPETVKLHTRNILSKSGATTMRDGFKKWTYTELTMVWADSEVIVFIACFSAYA